MKTGIITLDDMLGGSGFPDGSKVLVRGGPGTGKTTLALQIAANHLSKTKIIITQAQNDVFQAINDIDEILPKLGIGFDKTKIIAIKNSLIAIHKSLVQTKYTFKEIKDNLDRAKEAQNDLVNVYNELSKANINLIQPENNLISQLQNNVDQLLNKLSEAQIWNYVIFISLETNPESAAKHMQMAFGINLPDGIKSPDYRIVNFKQAEELTKKRISNLNTFIDKLLREFYEKMARLEYSEASGLIIIDSLNILATMFMVHGSDYRNIIHDACVRLNHLFRPATVVLIAEHDPYNPQSESVAAESYFCDIDIQLVREPVVTKRATVPGELTARGGLSIDWGRPDPHRPETRLFCRVIKSRTCDCQSRRCTYDIVSGQGINFYETYPADGQIMLFAENYVQQEEWEFFFATDLFQQYPALQFGMFGRTGIQRAFASLRHFQHIPPRTDLYLSSFDTYWINWYQEFCLRFDLADKLRKSLMCGNPFAQHEHTSSEKMIKNFARIVGMTQKKFAEWLPLGAPPDNGIRVLSEAICTEICNFRMQNVNPCNNPCANNLYEIIDSAWQIAASQEHRGGLLHPLQMDKIKFFGDHPTKIIRELDADVTAKGTVPIFCPALRGLQGEHKELLAVPYNANIGMLVCRKDLLQKMVKQLREDKEKQKRLENRLVELHLEKTNAVNNFLKYYTQKQKNAVAQNDRINNGNTEVTVTSEIQQEVISTKRIEYALPVEIENQEIVKRMAEERVQELISCGIPSTWEEVIALCLGENNSENPRRHFLIESQTFTTQLCTLMELIWSVGGSLKVAQDYSIISPDETIVHIFEAFWIFRKMRGSDIIPRNPTLEVKDFAEKYGLKKDGPQESPDWLFARHWHSTLVDLLTARDESGKQFIWQLPTKDMELDIAPIPITLSKYITSPKDHKSHHSCWGEWYFACLKGSENTALAIDLINNLMSSRKVCERAFSCAALPTVETFYDMYGEVECFNIPERSDIKLPKITFKELRDMLFKSARSRTEVFDYRHCIRYLHSVMEQVHDSPQISVEILGQRLVEALEKIKLHGETEIR